MTVRRGEPWGECGPLAAAAPVFSDDRSAALHVGSALGTALVEASFAAAEHEPIELGLLGGDLHRSLGSPAHTEADLRNGGAVRHPVDLGVVQGRRVDGTVFTDCFLAHLVAMERRRVGALFAVRTVVAMNATHRGEYDLGPRAHPNDGLLDVTDGRLLLGDRLMARRRMRSGTHLPHPMLATSRTREFELRFSRPAALELDGCAIGSVTSLRMRCVADAVAIVA